MTTAAIAAAAVSKDLPTKNPALLRLAQQIRTTKEIFAASCSVATLRHEIRRRKNDDDVSSSSFLRRGSSSDNDGDLPSLARQRPSSSSLCRWTARTW